MLLVCCCIPREISTKKNTSEISNIDGVLEYQFTVRDFVKSTASGERCGDSARSDSQSMEDRQTEQTAGRLQEEAVCKKRRANVHDGQHLIRARQVKHSPRARAAAKILLDYGSVPFMRLESAGIDQELIKCAIQGKPSSKLTVAVPITQKPQPEAHESPGSLEICALGLPSPSSSGFSFSVCSSAVSAASTTTGSNNVPTSEDLPAPDIVPSLPPVKFSFGALTAEPKQA